MPTGIVAMAVASVSPLGLGLLPSEVLTSLLVTLRPDEAAILSASLPSCPEADLGQVVEDVLGL